MPKKGEHKYSDEYLAKVASGYNTVKEFTNNDSRIYKAIKRYGLYEKLCGHLKREYEQHGTKEELSAIAAKYDDLTEFKKGEPHVYSIICQRGLYHELCAHMKKAHVRSYTDEELAEIALQYDDEKEFYTKHKGAFLAIYRRGLLDKLCAHMKKRGSWYRRKIYAFEFVDGCAYVGLSRCPEKRYKQHVSGKGESAVFTHIKQTGAACQFKILTDWLEKEDAAKTEEQYRKQYASDGWKMLNRVRGGALGSSPVAFTETEIRKVVSQYDDILDFKKGSPKYYSYLRRHELFDKYSSHMRRVPISNKERKDAATKKYAEAIASCKTSGELYKKHSDAYKWLHKHQRLYEFYPKIKRYLTDEERMVIITSCKTIGELQKKSPREYKWLLRHNRLDEFFPK